jgi:hypothetical protein
MALSAIWVLGLGAVSSATFPISDTVGAFKLAGVMKFLEDSGP